MATYPDPYAESLAYPRSYIIAVITAVAVANAVDPTICLATAYHESGFDPFNIGDNGTSFGLFQLHEGGELPAGKDQFWAFKPLNNCNIAIPEIARMFHAHPGWSAGKIAAAAQRPADPSGYALIVDGYANTIRTKGVSALTSASVFRPHNVPFTKSQGDPGAPAGGQPLDPGAAIPQGITGGAFTGASDWLLSKLGIPNLGVLLKLLFAVLLGVMGLLFFFHKQVTTAAAIGAMA